MAAHGSSRTGLNKAGVDPATDPVGQPRPEVLGSVPRSRDTPVYTISEVASLVGVSPATLRIWERQGLVSAARSPAGHRLYGTAELERLKRVVYLRSVRRLNAPGIKAALGQERRVEPTQGGRASDGGDDPRLRLGAGLRRLRKQRGLTLLQAAKDIGISISFLSSLERNEAGVSMPVLLRILNFYDTSLQRLTGPVARSASSTLFSRPGHRRVLRGSIPGVTIEQLARGTLEMEPELFTIEPGFGSLDAYSHLGEEVIYVLEGTLEFTMGDHETYVLAAGDCLYLTSSVPHRWLNRSKSQVRLLWVCSARV